jgi:hypothetical protein
MQTYDTIRTGTWVIAIPSDWIDKSETESGALLFESSDGEKAIYISTWNLGNIAAGSSNEIAESFRETEFRSLRNMEGYSWKTLEDQVTHIENSTFVVIDCYAEAESYRIAGKILARPPVVVRAAFHDYACENYESSRLYFAPIIDSLRFDESAA